MISETLHFVSLKYFLLFKANSSESKDYLQVCLRVRPFTQPEKEHESEGCVYILDSQTVVLKDPQYTTLGRLSEKSSGQMAQKFSFSKVGTHMKLKIFLLR